MVKLTLRTRATSLLCCFNVRQLGEGSVYEGLADRPVEPASERLEGDGSDSALFDPRDDR